MPEAGSCTTTYRKKLLCRHPEWFEATKELYNQVLNFYYRLLKQYPEIAALSSHRALRELEKLTIMGRDKKEPLEPLPFERLPLYFRRAAVNGAVGMMHSYLEKHRNWERKEAGEGRRAGEPGIAEEIYASPVFYKGMYKEFRKDSILLKVFTGSSWCWMKCRLKGRSLPDEGEWLSPTVVVGKRFSMLHIPVKEKVEDARSAKERVDTGGMVCGISFSNSDVFASCAVYDTDGRAAATRFIRGGKEYVHHSKWVLDKIRHDRRVMGKRFDWKGASRKDWQRLKRIREHYAHVVSREILDFCQEYGVKVIAVAKTERKLPAYIMKNLPGYSPYLLNSRIKDKLAYKAWCEGIVICGVRAHYTANKCHICRSYLMKENKPGRIFRCKAGHTGNRDLNTAQNIACACLKKYGKTLEEPIYCKNPG